MFGNKDPQPRPVSHYVNTNPDAGKNPTPRPPINPYPNGPTKVNFVPEKSTEKNKTIALFLLAITTILFAGLFVWKYIDWASINNEIEKEVKERVNDAELGIVEEIEEKYEARENATKTNMRDPEEYGSLALEYPKSWSLYIVNDKTEVPNNTENAYEAYLHPDGIRPITKDSVFALRVQILDKDYEAVINEYNKKVADGSYTHGLISINDGSVNADTYTSTEENMLKKEKKVIFKIRTQTVIIGTDAVNSFGTEFNNIVNSITFVK